MKLRKTLKKGFTLVELIVVIAIIAILAAVSAVSYIAFINQANKSADEQTVTQVNLALQADEMLNGKCITPTEAVSVAEESGFLVEKLTPTSSGYKYAWNSNDNRFYILEDNKVVYPNAADTTVAHYKLYKFVSNETEIGDCSAYLKANFELTTGDTLALTTGGVDVGENDNVNKITYTHNDSANPFKVVIRTNGGEVTIDAASDDVDHYGFVDKIIITNIASRSYVEYGVVEKIDVNTPTGHVVVDKDAFVGELDTTNAAVANIEVAGEVAKVTGNAIPESQVSGYIEDNTGTKTGSATNLTTTISTLGELKDFRDKVNAGRKYKGLEVNLSADIDISSSFWKPIGIGSRKAAGSGENYTGYPFMGTFNGNNHTISGLNNKGYESTFNYFAAKHNNLKTYSYGLFGIVDDATINNLKMADVNIQTMGSSKDAGGDSIGAIIGFCAGSLSMDNCSVSGTVVGFDATAGLVGRCYDQDGDGTAAENIIIKNCTNNASVSADIKVAGIVGFISPQNKESIFTCEISSCSNTGKIVSIKGDKDGYASGIVCYGGRTNSSTDTTIDVINYSYIISNNSNSGEISIEEENRSVYIAAIANNCASNLSTTHAKVDFTANSNTYTSLTTLIRVVQGINTGNEGVLFHDVTSSVEGYTAIGTAWLN